MRFDVIITGERHDAGIVLKDNVSGTSCEVFGFGALLNRFIIPMADGRKKNIVDGFYSLQEAKEKISTGFKSAKLSPFVCRLANGDYSFEGAQYHIDKFYLGKEAIHGLLYDAAFTINRYDISDEKAVITLDYAYTKHNEGFPFAFDCSVTYSLFPGNRLHIETVITNTGKLHMPVADGWHPYFTLGETIDEALLTINSAYMLQFDERLLPTGELVPCQQFAQPAVIGATSLDNCFVLKNTQESACVLRDDAAGLQLRIEAEEGYPYLQVYTPDHRKSIAIENLSSAPDAFNNGMGLQVLEPGKCMRFAAAYTVDVL